MIFTERNITIRNDSATINAPVILYRGDKNVEVRFILIESPYKYSNRDSINIFESTDASYAQLVIKTPNDREPIFGDITAVGNNNVTFVIRHDMIDEIEEVGKYDFQIRLFDADQTSMATTPEVTGGFIIKEPIAKEDSNNNITNSATVGSAVVTNDLEIPTFVSGSYNKTAWHDGDVISKQKLNKMEDGIYETYELSKDNSSQIKEKVNRGEGGVITNAMLSQEVKESMTGGSVAVVGKDSILEENIVDRQVTRNKVADGVMDIYPFQPRAKFRHNKQTTLDSDYESAIRGLVKDIRLYNADRTKQYYIQAINRNVNGSYYIAICDSDNIKVCEFNTNNYTESGLDIIKLYSTNSSGIYGMAVVDWSKFKQNKGIFGMDYEETGLQIGVIVDNDGANLKDYSISRVKLTDDSLMTYPFQPRANFKHNGTQYRESIRKSIKDIYLYGAKPNKKYAISSLWRSVGDGKIYLIEIVEVLEDNSTVVVARNEKWAHQEPTGIDEFKLAEHNNSGINAVVYIDWSKIPLGQGYFGMKYNETGIDIRCCKEIIPTISSIPEPPKTEIPNIILPQKIYATIGHELNIYYESVVDCDNVFNYKVDVDYNGEGAKQLEECFRVNPTTAGNYRFTLKLYRYGDLVASKACTISVVKDKTLGDIRGLYIGDSITEQNWYLSELQKMIPTFKSVGKRGDWSGLNHEGRSGWATIHYLNNTSYLDKTNTFYNSSSNSFDFNYYMSNSSIETPSFVTLALGTNDAGKINADTLVANFNTMINSIRSYDSNMKIGITIAPPPASNQDGWGKHNSVGITNWTHKKRIFEFAKKIIETFDNREDEGIYILPIYVNIDPVLDFPYEEVEVSFRNKTVIKRGTDNVHPSKEGMYKISDIHYNWIKAIF